MRSACWAILIPLSPSFHSELDPTTLPNLAVKGMLVRPTRKAARCDALSGFGVDVTRGFEPHRTRCDTARPARSQRGHPSVTGEGWPLCANDLVLHKCPQGDLNSCRSLERAVSWTWLDDGGIQTRLFYHSQDKAANPVKRLYIQQKSYKGFAIGVILSGAQIIAYGRLLHCQASFANL